MKTAIKQLPMLLFAAVFIFAGCSKDGLPKDEKTDVNYQPGQIPGMGEARGELTGEPFVLPENIEIKGGIKGESSFDPKDFCQLRGSGGFVSIELELVNHLNKDTLLVLPAGLTFRADNIIDQNGLLVQQTTIPLKKGQTCKTLVYTYCINMHKSASTPTSTYTFGPVTDADLLRELIALLKDKRLNYEHLEEEAFFDKVYPLQEIIWNITERDGITKEDRDLINSW